MREDQKHPKRMDPCRAAGKESVRSGLSRAPVMARTSAAPPPALHALTTSSPAWTIEVKEVDLVALWAWDVAVQKCAICRNDIMDMCIECQAADPSAAAETPECLVAWGTCNHAFHEHCISRWLEQHAVCPLDNTPWDCLKVVGASVAEPTPAPAAPSSASSLSLSTPPPPPLAATAARPSAPAPAPAAPPEP